MFQTDPFAFIALLVGMSLLPFVAMIATSYLKIVVVMSLIRNALGIQSIPPNMVINALAMILSFFIMAPTFSASWNIYKERSAENKPEVTRRLEIAQEAAEPFRDFLVQHTDEKQIAFFASTA